MKKESVLFALFLILATTTTVFAAPPGGGHRGGGGGHHRSHVGVHASYHSSPVYLIKSDYSESEQEFKDCKDHYLITRTTINYYSNGTRRVFNAHSVYNSDGTVLIPNCTDIKHTIYNKKHFFLVRLGGKYQIMDSTGTLLSKRNYTQMKEISPNKLLVRVDKKYGIIDLNENKIVPIKYKKFEPINKNLFLTKLNGYYGMIDSSNNIVLKNEYDKIKRVYDTYILKRDGDFGLVDINGKIILPANNDKIKKLGEYILVKKDGRYDVYDSDGNKLNDIRYKKIRLERNTLEGKIEKTWEEIEDNNL